MGQELAACLDTSPEGTQNRAVASSLQELNSQEQRIIKLLLLGAGGSGKSTIFKQMKIIHQTGYSREEQEKQRDVVRRNIFEIFNQVITYAELNDYDIDKTEFFVWLRSQNHHTFPMKQDLVKPLQELWNSEPLQKAFANRAQFDLQDNAEYFIKELPRFCAPDYLPTNEDILRTRVKTIGITENMFTINNFKFKMVDVGGQRNERRKWIHAFDAVTCVIFVVALSEYDQVLAEVEDQNRMKESFKLFDDICNQRFFKEKPVIIFFNKSDIFDIKIKKVNINVCDLFKDYKGELGDVEGARKHIINTFVQLGENGCIKKGDIAAQNKTKKRLIYNHVTNATDTTTIKKVFDDVRSIILHKIITDNKM